MTEPVVITESAAAKIKALMADEPEGEATVLRVAVQGGGCSGFEYALGFDRGAEIDYLETIQESGFKISNPNAVSACGCGHSFQVAEGESPDDAHGCGSGCSH